MRAISGRVTQEDKTQKGEVASVVGKCFASQKKKKKISFKLLYVLVLNCLNLKVKQCQRKYL